MGVLGRKRWPLSANQGERLPSETLHRLPIGVFDSGVGGLTVLQALQRALPHESFVYFGDTANVPYGTRTPAEILAFSQQILDWLVQVPVKMAIVACNTSSALALDIVRSEYNIPILGIILPGARAAAIHGQRIGVIATPATVNSDCYRRAILEKNPAAEVTQVACPNFVPIIENNRIHEPQTLEIVKDSLQALLAAKIDTLVYGCTHYPHLAPVIEPLLPPGVQVMNPATYMAKAAAQELEILQLQNSPPTLATQFFVSGCPEQFANLSAQWLGYRPRVQSVQLATLGHAPVTEAVEVAPPVDA